MNTPHTPRRVLDPLQAAGARLWAELCAWASPLSNPFVAQERHTQTRGAALFKTLLVLALVGAPILVVAWLISNDGAARADREVERAGVGLVIALTLVAGWGLARLRDGALLRLEVIKGRFEALQLLPIEAARRAWLWSAPNSLAGLLVCATGWPAVLWGLGGGVLSGRDALGLLLLTLMAAWGAPLWRPTLWQMQAEKRAVTGTDLWNSAAKSDGFVAPGGGQNLGWSNLFWVGWLALQGGIFGAALGAYWDGLPAHLRAASEDIGFTWPLFAARWLTEAQPFFGFKLAMFWLVIPLWLATSHNRILRLGAVTGQEPYWNEARLRNWQRAQQIASAALISMGAGLLWPGAIEGAWLASWFEGLKTTTAWALAAWWILALGCGALAATAAARAALEQPLARGEIAARDEIVARGSVELGAQIRRAVGRAGRALLVAPGVFLGACVLGGRWPFNAFWLQILPASLAVAAVWLGAQIVVWSASRSPSLKNKFAVLHAIWFYGAPATCLILLWLQVPLRDLLPAAYYFSPWTLWLLLRDAGIGQTSLFWLAIAGHAALIAAGAALLWKQRHNAAIRAPLSNSSPVVALGAAPKAGAKAGAKWHEKAAAAAKAVASGQSAARATVPAATATKLARKPLPPPQFWVKRVLNWAQRFDNPLLVLELRRTLLSLSLVVLAAWSNGVMAFVCLVYLPLMGLINRAFPMSDLTVALVAALVGLGLAPLIGLEGAANAYDRDRLDGSLQMLFLAPRTEAEIGWGKLGPYAIKSALLMLALSPIWLLGLLLSLLVGEPLLTMTFLVLPLWVASFNARNAALSHWTALKKRKIGPGHAPLGIVLAALCALPNEIAALVTAYFNGPFVLGAAVAGLALIYALEVLWFWKRGQIELRRQRFHGAPVVR